MDYQIIEIKDLAIKNEISQKDISKETNIDQANISRIFKGKTSPTLNTYNKIVDAIIKLSI